MKHVVFVSLALVFALAAGGCPPPSISDAALVAGTYLGTLSCHIVTELGDGTVVVNEYYSEAASFMLAADGRINIQGHDYILGAVYQSTTPDVLTVETVTGVVRNDTSVLTQSNMVQNPLSVDAVYTSGQRNIVIQAISSSEVEMSDMMSLLAAGGMSSDLQCGGTLSR